jgi:hypothetical protein
MNPVVLTIFNLLILAIFPLLFKYFPQVYQIRLSTVYKYRLFSTSVTFCYTHVEKLEHFAYSDGYQRREGINAVRKFVASRFR